MRWILLLCSTLWAFGSFAADVPVFDDSKVINKSFAVEENVEVEISNKYGDVVITTGTSDSVVVRIEIKAFSEKLDRVDELMQMVDVNFSSGTDYVDVYTEWGKNTSTIKKGMADIARILGGNSRIEINYFVQIPPSAKLEISNKFGNISVPSLTEDLRVDLSHGNFRAKKLSSLKKLNMSYGKANIKEIKKGNLDLKFTDLKLDKAGKINVSASSGEVEIEEVSQLNLTVKHGSAELEEVDVLSITSTLSEIDIEKLNVSLSGSMKYGEFTIDEVGTDFTSIDVASTLASIDLGFNSQIAFEYDVILNHGKGMHLPSTNNNISSRKTLDKDEIVKGRIATKDAGGKMSSVVVNGKYCSVSLEVND